MPIVKPHFELSYPTKLLRFIYLCYAFVSISDIFYIAVICFIGSNFMTIAFLSSYRLNLLWSLHTYSVFFRLYTCTAQIFTDRHHMKMCDARYMLCTNVLH